MWLMTFGGIQSASLEEYIVNTYIGTDTTWVTQWVVLWANTLPNSKLKSEIFLYTYLISRNVPVCSFLLSRLLWEYMWECKKRMYFIQHCIRLCKWMAMVRWRLQCTWNVTYFDYGLSEGSSVCQLSGTDYSWISVTMYHLYHILYIC